jgi:hypothetical protein
MPTNLFVNLTGRYFLQGPNSFSPLTNKALFSNDVDELNLYLLEETADNNAPLAYSNPSIGDLRIAIGAINGAPTSGTWVLDGNTLQFSATAADIQTALRTSQTDNALTVFGNFASGFTVTWGANGAESLLAIDASQLLPDCDASVVERRAGSGSVRAQQYIRVATRPVAYDDSNWVGITRTITPTIAETIAGSATTNEIQSLVWNREPASGEFTITLPADTRTITAAVAAGIFTTTANHGLAIEQPIIFSSLTSPANVANGTTYYVASIPSRTTFLIATEPGGSAIANATADAGTATVTTFAEATAPIAYNASPSVVQSALQAMSSIGIGNVSVSGVAGKNYSIQFTNQKGLAQLPAITAEVGSMLAAPGFRCESFSLATYGVRDLLAGNPSAPATLEIELMLNDPDLVTAAQTTITLTRDLIDGTPLSPVAIPTLPLDLASQAEAEAGTNNTKWLSPLRLWQALAGATAKAINGAVTLGGNLTVQGNTTLGDASGDTLTITSQTVTASNANGTAAGSIANVGTLDARYGRLASRPLGLAYNSNASWATYADGPAHGEGTVAFAGGVLIPDGQVVLVPTGTEIGLYNPATGNYTAGPTHGEAGIGFTGGVLLPDGNVVLVPFNSANVGIYNPSTGNYTAGVAHGRGANAWVGGVLLPDGRVLFVPTGSGVDIGLYDPVANTFAVGPGANGLAGGVLLPNGRVLLVPITNSNIRIFNPADNTLATGPAATGYYGGVLLPDGRVMLVPWTAANIGLYDPVANTFTSGPAHGQGANAFVGGVALPNGRVLLVPRESTVVGFYDPIANTYTNGPTHGAGAAAFSGGVLLPDGRVLLVPRNAANLGLVDSFQPAPGRILGPFYNKL